MAVPDPRAACDVDVLSLRTGTAEMTVEACDVRIDELVEGDDCDRLAGASMPALASGSVS